MFEPSNVRTVFLAELPQVLRDGGAGHAAVRGVPPHLSRTEHDDLRRFVPHARSFRNVVGHRPVLDHPDEVHGRAGVAGAERLHLAVRPRAARSDGAVLEDDGQRPLENRVNVLRRCELLHG